MSDWFGSRGLASIREAINSARKRCGFETKTTKVTKISRTVVKEYDAQGNIIRETSALNDGGAGMEEAEKILKEAEEFLDRTAKELDNLFKD